MSGRGVKRRGRPPKATTEKKYQLLKKPKYLQNDSSFSTPSASRASSPQDSEESSRKSSLKSAKKRGRPPAKAKRGAASTSFASRKSYTASAYNEDNYHYGSDFGDSTDKSDDDMQSRSESPESFVEESDSDFSLSSYSNAGPSASHTRSVTPEPVWIKDDIEIPPLELPRSSDDLMISKQYVLRALSIYEVLRRYRNLVRMSPFRVEDFCAALTSDDQSALFTEIHISLLKAMLREEDSQQTHFGPLDQKDSLNISLYLMDSITWPEVLRIYVESDPSFSREVLEILSTKEYPYTEIEDKLTVLQFLTDQFLTTTFVRDDMIQEGPIHYDDHCRVCHRLGNLLCCETCPAVYHLECVDPPLEDVPTEDWQCNICKSHSTKGVNDCITSQEKQGALCRQEHFGFDRHARKYWFVCRRLFIETEDGSETWYYSTLPQFENVFKKLDGGFLEKELVKELENAREQIEKHMQITETLTNELKGSKKSYLEVENERLAKNLENGTSNDSENNTDDAESAVEGAEVEKVADTHLTRLKTNQISKGTLFYKLGMENGHLEYSNQYTTNPLALNKPQKNEERDKKRHLSHKFSLTDASLFKWNGVLNGSHSSLSSIFKQTLLGFESQITPTFMHCNWPKLKKAWVNAVAAATTPNDFVRVLVALQSCFKNSLYANVWHEQLGHIHLYRITSNEREERKKIEKREKREESEEERNRLSYNYVKYSLGLRHQVWKQKGEEYRIHGQWGWLWSTRSRRAQLKNELTASRIHRVNIVVKHDEKTKVLSLKRQTYENLQNALATNEFETKIELESKLDECYGSIDISEALKATTRVLYPKIAKKTSIDDLLERREKLRDMEVKKKENNTENTPEIPENVIPVPESHQSRRKVTGSTVCIQKFIQDITDNKSRVLKLKNADTIEKCLKVHKLVEELREVERLQKIHRCYSEQCRNATIESFSELNASTTKCFSGFCLKELTIKSQIVALIQQLKDKYTGVQKKGSILHQKLAEAKNSDLLDILNKYHLGDFMTDEHFIYDLKTCVGDIEASLGEAVEYDQSLVAAHTTKIEPKAENGDAEPEIKELKEEADEKDEMKPEEEDDEEKEFVRKENRRFLAFPKPARKETPIEKELDADGKEKIYSTTSTAGRIYLKKPEKLQIAQNGQVVPVNTVKYPAITTFTTMRGTKSILILPKHELEKCARKAGKYYAFGFNHQAKNNNSVWPYPCSRPFFRQCWFYRTLSANSFSALALQLRIVWTCIRWDDMQTKPTNFDGKNQITTDTEIVTTEILKHRNVGLFMENTQYFRRRVVIPLELPKTVREVTSIRSGLRKRKRAESPQQTDPQVAEEWVDEDKLELWEIRQYVEKIDRANVIPTTRTSTGKLPLPRQLEVADTSSPRIVQKISGSDAKERMEQQLRQQREANNKKRIEELNKGPVRTIIRKVLVRNPDGTTRIVNETTTIQSKPEPQPQKIQVLRQPDGKLSVRGLQPNQKLVQTQDGKYLILPANSNVVGGKVVHQAQQVVRSTTAASTVTTATTVSSPVQQPPQKVVIRSVPQKTIISANAAGKELPTTSTASQVSSTTGAVQKILTTSGQIITQPVQNNVISSANLQQLLQRGAVQPGQKIVVQSGPGGVQKLLVASSQQQQQQSGEKRIIIQNAQGQQQQIILQSPQNSSSQQQFVSIGGQKIILQSNAQQVQQLKTVTSPVQSGQQIQFQIQESPQQQQQQIIVQNNGNIAQQLTQGSKFQVMNINGQQVLVKTTSQPQQVVVKTSQAQLTPVKQTVQTVVSNPTNQQIVKTIQIPATTAAADNTASEQAMLAGHPPGTTLKCVTAQVVQTQNGPRIVLQGLNDTKLDAQQTALIQQQVKQQLMKAQESGKGQPVGPTKIYLAITPQRNQSQPPPLTPVQNVSR